MYERHTLQSITRLFPARFRLNRDGLPPAIDQLGAPGGGRLFFRKNNLMTDQEVNNVFLAGLTRLANNMPLIRAEAKQATLPKDIIAQQRRSAASQLVTAVDILASDQIANRDRREDAVQLLAIAYFAYAHATNTYAHESGILGKKPLDTLGDIIDIPIVGSPLPTPRQIAFIALYPEAIQILYKEGII